MLGGGVAHLGQDLVRPRGRGPAEAGLRSPFLAALDLAGRLRVVPEGQPVAAIGAALLGRR